MDPLFVQNLRYKLQRRISRLNSIDGIEPFLFSLQQFWRFFDQQKTFVGITESLLAQFPNLEEDVAKIFQGETLFGETEEEAAALGYKVLRNLDINSNNFYSIIPRQSTSRLEAIRELFLEPFYEYIDEQLDDQRAMLALLMRYKHRSEWFHRDKLWETIQSKREQETLLALDLYSYLYDQGIDFTIEPSSVTGEIDLIAAQDSKDPLLLDAKIFDGDKRDKYYIRKGFNQIYTYTQQYNEPFGYLVIYRTTDVDLKLSLELTREFPVVVHNHKTIFILIIDIYSHAKPVSQRKPLKAIEITEEELINIVEGMNRVHG